MCFQSNENDPSSISKFALEERVEQLESNRTFQVTQDAIRQRELEFLQHLRIIQSQLQMEQQGGSTSSAEVDALKAENASLSTQLAKQGYRIQHLLQAMETKQIWNM